MSFVSFLIISQTQLARNVSTIYLILPNSYTQTVPSRVVKDILAAGDIDHDDNLSVEEIQKLLRNIQSREEFTSEEIQAWMHDFHDTPETANTVPVAKMKERMLEVIKEKH